MLNGGISVEGYDGDQVLVEAMPSRDHDGGSDERVGGMRRIPNTSVGLTISEENNVVEVNSSWASRTGQLHIRVPRQASLRLSCTNNGDLQVSGVEGELELHNVNGSVSAVDVSGTVVAETTNGEIKVTFDRVDADKAMSFVTLNGDVDVSFPASFKAALRINAGQGEIYTDFDFQLDPQEPKIDKRESTRGYTITMEREVRATIGGGGPEIYFKTWNGDIFIRRSAI
jgi:hypothetical protein